MENDKWIQYILINAGMKFRNKKKFRYSIPAYTGPFRALFERVNNTDVSKERNAITAIVVLRNIGKFYNECGSPSFSESHMILKPQYNNNTILSL
jgi:hypothetical protein